MPQQLASSVENIKGGLPEKEYMKKWYLGRKEIYKESHLKRTYGLTIDDLISLIEGQDYKCIICKVDLRTLNPKNVHVDHCHSSDKIRGILCNKCNMALGLLNDDVNLFKICIEYLKK